MAQAGRFSGPGQPYEGLVRKTSQGFKWTGNLQFIAKDLAVPLRWREPKRIFVNSMSDLFHDEVDYGWILAILTVCAFTPQHTYQILTKRPQRMYEVMTDIYQSKRHRMFFDLSAVDDYYQQMNLPERWRDQEPIPMDTVLPNVHLGVSCENQATADERIPWLLKTPAAVRFLSCEPLLDAVDLSPYLGELPEDDDGAPYPGRIDQVIIGGESGPRARRCRVEWIKSLIDQCQATGTACFIKQMGAYSVRTDHQAGHPVDKRIYWQDRKGGDPDEWPRNYRIRQYPEVVDVST
jgi:protein gp37